MSIRSARVLAVASLLPLAACGSKSPGTRAQEPVDPTAPETSMDSNEPLGPDTAENSGAFAEARGPSVDQSFDMEAFEAPGASEPTPVRRFGPAPWTGAFGRTAVLLADSYRIEGPTGLLEHVVASSDDALYERAVELTPDGLMQVITRTGGEVREIRVQVDAWSLAAMDRVVILERVEEGPVRIIASGEALWRDVDSHLLKGNRLEFTGEIGNEAPFDPSAHEAAQGSEMGAAADPSEPVHVGNNFAYDGDDSL